MNKIVFPLKLQMQGFQIGDLQDALQQCLDRRALLANDERTRRELSAAFQRERAERAYGDATSKLVGIFQKERGIQPSGEVDEASAGALNKLLGEWGLLDKAVEPAFLLVTGSVRREDGFALQGMQVRAAHQAEKGSIRLGEDITDAEGRYTIRYQPLPEVDTISLRVSVIGEDGKPLRTSEVVHHARPLQTIDLMVPATVSSEDRQIIEGTIVLEHGLPAEKLQLRLYRRDFGGKATRLSETTTLEGGRYAFAYNAGSRESSLEVRAVKADGQEIPLSKPMNQLSRQSRASLNLVAPGSLQPLAAEYLRLSADLTPLVGQMTKLAEAKESAEQQDLTVLNRATGWDARLIALAAMAERLSADTDVKLPQEPLYGLLRAGLPSDKQILSQVSPDVAEQALRTVRDAGIVELSDDQIGQFKKDFTTFSTKLRLSLPVPGSRATYGELLQISGLKDDEQAKFASVYLSHRGDASELWDKARKDVGLDDAQIGKLQLQGKLAFLAGNSKDMTFSLMNRLVSEKPLNDPVQLVEQDFHRAEQWKAEITALAGNDEKKLDALIPLAYGGEKIEDRLGNYADDMARKIRISYPTHVVSRMIERDEIKLPKGGAATAKLLKNAAAQGFRLGETQVETFLKTHVGVTADLTDNDIHVGKQQMKMLQSVYQITPSNDGMPVLINLNMNSGLDVMLYTEPQFIALYERNYYALYGRASPQEESRLIYRKARQVSSVTYNLFTIAKKLNNEPRLAGMPGPLEVQEGARNELIKHFPSMESLFGSMDFCECEHCRSVLSPAAYLVDLLQFIDPEPEVWVNFQAEWKATHDDQDYPHKDRYGKALKPYDVLAERRPDLPHIPLTCENTHTALPYIDIVNEILEYYVANGRLAEEAVRDTGGATTEELLAEPQNVIREAYDKLHDERYPLNLPFDLWLETVRQFCNYFDTPLPQVLEVLRPSDDLFAPTQTFDRSNIFIESLGFSPAEWTLFTAADHLTDDKWHELYGFPTLRPVIQSSTNDGHGVLTIPNDAAEKFGGGFACTYFDVSTNTISGESNAISSIGSADSGGAGLTTINFTGTWTANPEVGDLLVCDAPATLKSAKTLSRRLGVTYKEVVEIVQAKFVNPRLADFGIFRKLGVSISDVLLYRDYPHLLDYQQFGLHTGTALHETDDRFEFLLAANGDLFAIKKSGEGLASTEIHILSAASKYQEFSVHTGTGLHVTDDRFEFLLAANRDLFVIKKSGTESNSTEVHVLSADSSYQAFSLHTETGLHETDAAFEFLLAPNRDLFAIKKSGAESNSTEVHVLSADSNYQEFSLRTETGLHEIDAAFEFLLAANRDLFAIKKSGAESNSTEVHILSADSNYREFSLRTATPLHETGGNFAFLLAANDNVFAIKKNGTESGSTEVHELVGLNGLPEIDRRRYSSIRSFQSRIAKFKKLSGFDVDTWLDAFASNAFDDIVLLEDPDTGCNFDLTTLRYANGSPADAIIFLRINLFVRLWRKLGWSIEETDRALCTFVPKNTPFDKDTSNLSKQPLRTALIYLAHLKSLDEKVRIGKQSRLKLVTLWSDITTDGNNPLYAHLFLTRSILKGEEIELIVDGQSHRISIFDDPLGRYLIPADVKKISEQVRHEVRLQNVKDSDKIDPALFSGMPKIGLRYDALEKVQHLSYLGLLAESDKQDILAVLRSDELVKLLDAVQAKARNFVLVNGHMLALQGALGLTADEIRRILEDAGSSPTTAELSLPNVSLIYRYGLLAKALKLSVGDLIALKQLSGLDPFRLLHLKVLSTLDEDYPYTQTLRFVEVVEEVKESGLTIEDLDYLLRHRFDETGKYRPDPEGRLFLLKALSEGVRAIRIEHAMPNDPGSWSEEILRQKLALVLAPDVVERLLAMVAGTVEFTATRTGVDSEDELNPETFTDEQRIRQISHREVPDKEQKLTVRGVLFSAQKAELEARVAAGLSANQESIFADLLAGVQANARAFFENQLKKQLLRPEEEAGFLEDGDFDALFTPLKPLQKIEARDTAEVAKAKKIENERIEQENQEDLQWRRFRIAQAFLPLLQQRLIRQFIVQTMTAHTSADPALVKSLLSDGRLLGNPKPLLESLSKIDAHGVTATFFAAPDGTGESLAKVFLPEANTELKGDDGSPVRPAGANSARFEGYLEVPAPGAYRFYVSMEKQGAETELRFAHLATPPLKGAASEDQGEVNIGYVELKPGIPYRFALNLSKLDQGGAGVLVQGETLPKRSLSQLTLYPLATMDTAEQALVLLTKTIQFLQGLGFSERETRYLLMHGSAFDNLDLNKLPWRDAQKALEVVAAAKREVNPLLSIAQTFEQARNENPGLAAEADHVTPLFKQYLRLASYARLKRDLAGNTDDLISIFEASESTEETTDAEKLDKKIYPLIAQITRRDETTVKITARILFGDNADFATEKPLHRLWKTLQFVERFGVPVVSMVEWTQIVSPATSPALRFEIARHLKEALKARFDTETWQRVAQPIFDGLRQRQRDALSSYVMHEHGFSRVEELYEYFLIDPGMEPVVQTSRIRLAISSLQLFIQRCLLNLELKVNPSVINARHWEWMKRYRVWEANRKIFLFPENWLEPEFRDDKTHLYVEMEGKLLQGDVSSDLVEDAFLNYLKKLDELAKLDIVAMHIEDNTDPARRVLHVIGRTFGVPKKYFYRRYVLQMWSPWEPVSEIEGDHLAPIVWRDRLYLFWVTFMDRPAQNSQLGEATSSTSLINATLQDVMNDLSEAGNSKQITVQLHWSEYFNGTWSSGESSELIGAGIAIGSATDPDDPYVAILPREVPRNFDINTVFVHVSKDFDAGVERGVYVHLAGDPIRFAFHLVSRNSAPEMRGYGEASNGPKPINNYSSANITVANRYAGYDQLKVSFQERISSEVNGIQSVPNPTILQQVNGRYTLLPCNNNLTAPNVSAAAFENAEKPAEVEAAIQRSLGEITAFMKPVFYQDSMHTFFIEPSVTEKTVEEWKDWVTRTPQPEQGLKPAWASNYMDYVHPKRDLPPIRVVPESFIKQRLSRDWLVNEGTVLVFDGVLVNFAGQSGLEIVTAGSIKEGSQQVKVNSGSGVPRGSSIVFSGAAGRESITVAGMAGGVNVVGGAGLNPMLARNIR